MNTLGILVAAGRGERMGESRPKAFLNLCGQPILLRAALAFEAAASVDHIVAVVPEAQIAEARQVLSAARKVREVVVGGSRRQDSVLAGLKRAPEGFDGIVLVHDAARPLVDAVLIEAVVAAAQEKGAAIPVLAPADTIKKIQEGAVVGTLDRKDLAYAQTPQGFRFELLLRAYEEACRDGVTLTDEAMAVERLGAIVAVVAGSHRNRKITAPEDLVWAETLLRHEARG